jgi:hypothetical protein
MWTQHDMNRIRFEFFINTDGETQSLWELLQMIKSEETILEKITIEAIAKDGSPKDLVLAEYDNEIELNNLSIFMSEQSGWLTLAMSSQRIWDGIEEFDGISIRKLYAREGSSLYKIEFHWRAIEDIERRHLDWREIPREAISEAK